MPTDRIPFYGEENEDRENTGTYGDLPDDGPQGCIGSLNLKDSRQLRNLQARFGKNVVPVHRYIFLHERLTTPTFTQDLGPLIQSRCHGTFGELPDLTPRGLHLPNLNTNEMEEYRNLKIRFGDDTTSLYNYLWLLERANLS